LQKAINLNHYFAVQPLTKNTKVKINMKWLLPALLFFWAQLCIANPQWIEQRAKVTQTKAVRYSVMIETAAEKYRLDERYLYALILKESTYREKVTTGVYPSINVGLMQIQPRYHKPVGQFKNQSLLNPEANIDTGSRLLAEHLNTCKGNYRCALEKYNSSKKKKKYAQRIIDIVNKMNLN
jgi:soluble lytic murein transglycosylase-like protein